MTWTRLFILIGAVAGGSVMWISRGAIDAGLDKWAAWKLERVNVKEHAKDRAIEERSSETATAIADTDMGGDHPVSLRLDCVYRIAAGERPKCVPNEVQ